MDYKILWIANADARGHLFRAHLASRYLQSAGIAVSILTTNSEGKKFLKALGTPSKVLPGKYQLSYDKMQNLLRRTTAFKMLTYLLFGNGLRDFLFIKKYSKNCHLIINDLHPVPIFASKLFSVDIVHMYGENLWDTVENHFFGIAPNFFAVFFQKTVRKLRNQSRGTIIHTLMPSESKAPTFYLPPLVDFTPRRRKKEKVLIYLNPYFSDPYIADSIEKTLANIGMPYEAIGEMYSNRENWKPYSLNFSETLSESSLVISAPGMNLLAQILYHKIPFIALLTDQPEQEKNLRKLSSITKGLFKIIKVSKEIDLYSLLKENIEILLAETRDVEKSYSPDLENSQALWTNTIKYFLDNRINQ